MHHQGNHDFEFGGVQGWRDRPACWWTALPTIFSRRSMGTIPSGTSRPPGKHPACLLSSGRGTSPCRLPVGKRSRSRSTSRPLAPPSNRGAQPTNRLQLLYAKRRYPGGRIRSASAPPANLHSWASQWARACSSHPNTRTRDETSVRHCLGCHPQLRTASFSRRTRCARTLGRPSSDNSRGR